jgi:hypothetical protein
MLFQFLFQILQIDSFPPSVIANHVFSLLIFMRFQIIVPDKFSSCIVISCLGKEQP